MLKWKIYWDHYILIALNAITFLGLTFVPDFAMLELSTKVNVFLTVNIMIFASIEANSTRKQAFDSARRYEIEDRRIKSEDLRNELEKAHGILFSILNNMYAVPTGGDTDEKIRYSFKNDDDKATIDDIFIKYPFMFSQGLREYWIKKIQDLRPDSEDGYEIYSLNEPTYYEFHRLVTSEYFLKADAYRALVG